MEKGSRNRLATERLAANALKKFLEEREVLFVCI
jgi:hypothetical protein